MGKIMETHDVVVTVVTVYVAEKKTNIYDGRRKAKLI